MITLRIGDGLVEEKPIPIGDGQVVLVKYNDAVRGRDEGRNLSPTRTITIIDEYNNLIHEHTEDNPYYWGEEKIKREYDEAFDEIEDDPPRI